MKTEIINCDCCSIQIEQHKDFKIILQIAGYGEKIPPHINLSEVCKDCTLSIRGLMVDFIASKRKKLC